MEERFVERDPGIEQQSAAINLRKAWKKGGEYRCGQ